MAYKKIDKEFCLTDDSVNVYGYRLLTSGLRLERFTPPIGYLMHRREAGVAVRWEDFRTEGGCLYAKPVVNESAFPDLAQQIEDGFYSAASVGHSGALAIDQDDASRLEGQTGPTVTEWFPRECSIVDIPGNYNAIARLYDEADNLLHDLSDNTKINKQDMDKATIDVAALGLPGLAADASVEQALRYIRDLASTAARVPALEKELADLRAATTAGKVQAIVEKGLADRKLTVQLADKLKADYKDNPEGLQALVDTLPAQAVVTKELTDIPAKYQGKTWRDLYLNGELEDVKRNYPDLYEQLKNNK